MATMHKPVRKLRERLLRLKLMLGFAWRRGASIQDRGRLFYHAGIKPALVFRRLRKFSPRELISFRVKAPGRNGNLRVRCRDNGSDVGTFAEFFSSRYQIIPPELPRFEPKVIYDIGAHIGIASLFFAMRYPKARLYGFEPLPLNYEVCTLNYHNLRDAKALPWAIGARSGTAAFEFANSDLRGGHLTNQGSLGGANGWSKLEVPVFSVLDLVRRQGFAPPDFLKIDTEGAEADVLEGIGDLAPNIQRLLVETHGEEVELKCLRWLLEHGFIIRHVHEAAPGFAAVWCDRV